MSWGEKIHSHPSSLLPRTVRFHTSGSYSILSKGQDHIQGVVWLLSSEQLTLGTEPEWGTGQTREELGRRVVDLKQSDSENARGVEVHHSPWSRDSHLYSCKAMEETAQPNYLDVPAEWDVMEGETSDRRIWEKEKLRRNKTGGLQQHIG